MSDDVMLDRVAVVLIRHLNAPQIDMLMSDQDLLDIWGMSARDLARPLLGVVREIVRDEVSRAIAEQEVSRG